MLVVVTKRNVLAPDFMFSLLRCTLSTARWLSTSSVPYAGHSKWANIKQTKGANDAAKSKIFQRATQDILVAARSGGVDPDKNAALAIVLKRLKAQDVPKENITKALVKAAKVKSSGDTSAYEAIMCDSVGVIIECATSNPNRTVQTLREILHAKGARMAAVGFMFSRLGVITLGYNRKDSEYIDQLTEAALDNGAQDFEDLADENKSQSQIQFICEPSELSKLAKLLGKKPVTVLSTEIVYKPLETSTLSGPDAELLQDLIQTLEDHDDVVRITHSAADSI
ncbi:hypothetical protein D9757_008294 [Collybiopsis confluens]|uniref:Uncharacterized protein n=1 Tax=Collybiopsis confluens TaxID=2823264 RepID=A0A8H5M0X1_9AGAR|nr:hypothetical protein D9757_008294 [Collybiopsis confluens]